MTTTEDVMNHLLAEAAPALPARVLADIFDRLIWILRDNGEEIVRVREAWLLGEDERKVEVALEMEEVFPFRDRAAMAKEFDRILARWPRFAPQCERILRDWDKNFEGKPQP